MSRTRAVTAVLFCLALVAPGSVAHASSSVVCTGYNPCEDDGYSHSGYLKNKSTSYWRMYTGTNCTNYVAYRLVTTNGMPNVRPNSGVGNARDWGIAMASITDKTPTVGSVAWWRTSHSHVAYVERVVSDTEIWVSESNWSGNFDWRKITKSGSGWPDGFIHFADPKLQNVDKPTVTGTVSVGSRLTATHGTWTPQNNMSYRYEWVANGDPIPGATARKFTPPKELVGAIVKVRVYASQPGFATRRATSAKTTVAPGTLSTSEQPVINGTPQVGQTLTATTPAWAPAPESYVYTWHADGEPIPDVDGPSLTLKPAHLGRVITLSVTAAREAYTSDTSTSSPTEAVIPAEFVLKERPSVSGSAKVGAVLTTTNGRWSPQGTYRYRWYANGERIRGESGPTLKLTKAMRGTKIKSRVTVLRDGYAKAKKRSLPTSAMR